jgi:hypothetical protein
MSLKEPEMTAGAYDKQQHPREQLRVTSPGIEKPAGKAFKLSHL